MINLRNPTADLQEPLISINKAVIRQKMHPFYDKGEGIQKNSRNVWSYKAEYLLHTGPRTVI